MTADFRAEVEALRPQLLRYATLELRDRDSAEDCVQEALLAALAGEASFEGRANLRTWLTGILKHKIVDAMRRSSRERTFDGEDEQGASQFDRLFDERGHWIEFPPDWGEPDGALEQKQFMQALERCLAGLPARTAQAFMLREHMGLDTDEICKAARPHRDALLGPSLSRPHGAPRMPGEALVQEMNLSCKEATRLMSAAQDRELSIGERAALKVHLAVCKGCRIFDDQMHFLRRALRRLFGQE